MSGSALPGPEEDASGERRAALIDGAFFGPNKQYVRWDTGLHELFEEAVEALGGAHAAKPANIRDRMGIPLLTTAQVKSHLQKHRIRVVAEKGTKDATEAQARAAAKLLERQKRQADAGAAPARPRVLVPIRGSRQLSGNLAAGVLPGGAADAGSRRPKRRSRKRKAYSDSFSSSEGEDEYGYPAEEWEGEQEEAAAAATEGAAAPARRSRRDRRRRRPGSSGSERGDSEGEGRSAGTTTASPSAPLGGRHAAQDAGGMPFVELSRMLSAEGVAVDPETIAGLAQRRAAFVAAAAAAAGLPAPPALPPIPAASRQLGESSGEPASTHQPALLLPGSSGVRLSSPPPAAPAALLSVDGSAALNRQAQLEHALLEQSMWVQKLAAEVQELRNRQRLGLPPPVPDATALSSPFALMAQAAFPGAAEPSPPGAQGARQPQLFQQQQPRSAMGTCDSALLRLLSSTLKGQGSWARPEASDPASMLLQGIEAAGAEASRQAEAALLPMPLAPSASNLLTCDSGLLRLLSQSLREAGWQQAGDSDATAQAAAAVAAAAARLAAEAGHSTAGPSLAAAAAAAAAVASPFAAAAAQGLPPPPLLPPHHLGRPPPLPVGLGVPSLGMAASNRSTSVDVLHSLLGLAGSAGKGSSASAARAMSTAEFLRLCSLPGAADLLPAGCD